MRIAASVFAGAAVVVGCPGAVVAGEGQPEVVAGESFLKFAIELECGQSYGLAVGDSVDDGGCGFGGEAFVLVGDQAGDGQGGAVESMVPVGLALSGRR